MAVAAIINPRIDTTSAMLYLPPASFLVGRLRTITINFPAPSHDHHISLFLTGHYFAGLLLSTHHNLDHLPPNLTLQISELPNHKPDTFQDLTPSLPDTASPFLQPHQKNAAKDELSGEIWQATPCLRCLAFRQGCCSPARIRNLGLCARGTSPGVSSPVS